MPANQNIKTGFSYLLLLVFYIANVIFTYQCIATSGPQVETLTTHLIITGVLYFIAVITTIQYFLFKDTTYLFYVLYIMVNVLYFSMIFTQHPEINALFPDWFPVLRYHLSLPLLTMLYAFYTLFAIGFLNLYQRLYKVYRLMLTLAKIFGGLFIISVLLAFLPATSRLNEILRVTILVSCMPVGFISILVLYIKVKTVIAKIFCIGTLCFFTGSVFGFLFSREIVALPSDTPPLNQWIFYTELGTLLEIILFTSSFAYRNKLMMEEDRQIKDDLLAEILNNQEKERKLQGIRNEIAGNLHDDIGASLSNINILNELAKRNKNDPDKAHSYLDKAGEDIQRISENLNDIVWNINPRYDDLQNLFIKMKRYAADMMEGKNISHELRFPETASQISLPMELRRDFYLVFKEAINNMAKYSAAKEAKISVEIINTEVVMKITDNGIGFAGEAAVTGNGIYNMRQRAAAMGARFELNSTPGEGTSIVLSLSVT